MKAESKVMKNLIGHYLGAIDHPWFGIVSVNDNAIRPVLGFEANHAEAMIGPNYLTLFDLAEQEAGEAIAVSWMPFAGPGLERVPHELSRPFEAIVDRERLATLTCQAEAGYEFFRLGKHQVGKSYPWETMAFKISDNAFIPELPVLTPYLTVEQSPAAPLKVRVNIRHLGALIRDQECRIELYGPDVPIVIRSQDDRVVSVLFAETKVD